MRIFIKDQISKFSLFIIKFLRWFVLKTSHKILGLIIIIFSLVGAGFFVYKEYKENKEISNFCVMASVKSIDLNRFISVDTCRGWIKEAGSLEKFRELVKKAQSY